MSSAILVSQFLELVQEGQHKQLASFLKEVLNSQLEQSDKDFFADSLISLLDETIMPLKNETLFHELIVFLYHFVPERCGEIARLYYIFGTYSGKGRYYLYAQDKISELKEHDGALNHLWGKILIALGHYVSEDLFFEQAIDKFQDACRQSGASLPLLWDWAKGWKELSDRSGEISDLKQAIAHFQKALAFKPGEALFFIHFAETLYAFAHLSGNSHYIDESIEMYKISLLKQETPQGWMGYAYAHVKRYELTHSQDHFNEANRVIEEAIAATPEQADLWMLWGELYLRAGWNNRTLAEVELAVEKLSSMKIQECSPVKVSALLSHALITLGLILEDLKLLGEGRERVLNILSTLPDVPQLVYTAGCSYLAHAIYFSDTAAFEQSVFYFQQGVERDITDVDSWFGLFQAYFGWANAADDPLYFRKCLKAIERVCQLRPCSPFYLMSHGVTLLSYSKHENSQEPAIEEAIVKFKKALLIREEFEVSFHYAHALNALGELTQDEKRYELAINTLTPLYNKLPTDMSIALELAIAHIGYGEFASNVGHLERAITLLEMLAQREKEDDIILTQLGYARLLLSELIDDPSTALKVKKLRSDAEGALIAAAQLGNGQACYYLACLYSITNHLDLALEYLLRTEQMEELPPIGDMEHDEWLCNLCGYDAFEEFLSGRRGEVSDER